jgi:hypothetical protein
LNISKQKGSFQNYGRKRSRRSQKREEERSKVKGKKKDFGELGSFKGIANQSDKQTLV